MFNVPFLIGFGVAFIVGAIVLIAIRLLFGAEINTCLKEVGWTLGRVYKYLLVGFVVVFLISLVLRGYVFEPTTHPGEIKNEKVGSLEPKEGEHKPGVVSEKLREEAMEQQEEKMTDLKEFIDQITEKDEAEAEESAEENKKFE